MVPAVPPWKSLHGVEVKGEYASSSRHNTIQMRRMSMNAPVQARGMSSDICET